jgi:hypothetical protein
MKPTFVRLLVVALSASLLGAGCDRPSSPAPTTVGPVKPSASAPAERAATAETVAEAGADASANVSVMGFDIEPAGATPAGLDVLGGDWTIASAGGAKGVLVDGSKKATAFPLAVARAPAPSGDLRLRVRFYPIAGSVDQAAGIAFGITPDGSYSAVRANALEDNLLYFTVSNGKRTVHDTVSGVATPSRSWHTLAVELRGKELVVVVDDARRFAKKLDAVPSGRVGLWSKADSKVLFDDFEVGAM